MTKTQTAAGRSAFESDRGDSGEFIVRPVLRPDGTLAEGAITPMDDDQLIEALTLMTRSRCFDERGVSYQRQGRIGVFGGASGQEAACVGTALAADPAMDWLMQYSRELPALLRFGLSLEQQWLMFIGHPAGWSFPPETRVTHMAIELGAQLPHAVGMAWGMRLQRQPGVVMTYFGDGASSEGDFYEAGNLAGVTKAPIVMVCLNNGWSISTPRSAQSAATTIAAKAAAFGIPGYVVDGSDVMGVYAVSRDAVARARDGGGPTLIEAVTYRRGSHNTADDASRYRSPEDDAEWGVKDPLARLRLYLTAKGAWDDQRDAELRETCLAEVDEAFRRAEQTVRPGPAALFDHVYSALPPRLERQRQTFIDEVGQ